MTATVPALVEDRFRAMGTDISILAPAEDEDAAVAARTILDSWDRRFSRFDPTSELSCLNATAGEARSAALSPDLLDAVETAVAAARATDGLFDPLLGARMVELGYDRTFERLEPGSAPTPSAWVAGRWREIRIDRAARTVNLPAGTALDLGGLAKGMAVDAALSALDRAGIRSAAVNAGGDLAVLGLPPGLSAWTVAIEGLADGPIALTQGALATSSIRVRRWRTDAGERHHLLDPRTGLPAASGLEQVSVVAATCAQAEVAAKSALLLGPDRGPAFLAAHRLHGILLGEDGTSVRV
jgi:thiamine biosynthesis lipoprotein